MSNPTRINDLIFEALQCANKNNYLEAKNIILSIFNEIKNLNEINASAWQDIGSICILLGMLDKAKDSFLNAQNLPSAAFCSILLDKFSFANELLNKSEDSSAKLWCQFLLDMFSSDKKNKHIPSFLAIRHYLEFTVYTLLVLNKHEYIQLIIKNLNSLLEINNDAEKFIGYAYLHFNLCDEAIKYIRNSIKRNQQDGEAHFVLGQLYFMKNDLNTALSYLNIANLFLPDHYPTQILLRKINNSLKL